MRFISILIGKTVLRLLRLMGRKGSALPGLIVEKLQPNFLNEMLSGLSGGVVIVSGTNGKTTTTKVISELLESQGLRVLTNKTGSNFVRGTVTTIVDKASFSGKLPYDIAVFEQDEAHAVKFVKFVKPRGVVILNVMRDQMDRFGEIDTTAGLLATLAKSATDWVVLNANDNRVAKIADSIKSKIVWYGHSKELRTKFLTDDELHHGDNTSYFKAYDMNSELIGYTDKSITVRCSGEKKIYQTKLTGSHNAINLTASLAVIESVKQNNIDHPSLIKSISSLEPAFGRGEEITLENGATITLQLVKNPGGFTHAIRMLDIRQFKTIGIVINDDYADGRDVSWLWDVDFDGLNKQNSDIFCGGVRGYDMAVRLKYDGVETKEIALSIPIFVRTINKTIGGNDNAIIFCTYTAMLKIRSELAKQKASMQKVSV